MRAEPVTSDGASCTAYPFSLILLPIVSDYPVMPRASLGYPERELAT